MRPPSEKPDDVAVVSPPVVDDTVEAPVRPRSLSNALKSPDSPDVDELGDPRLCSALGTEESSCDSVDCEVPAEVPTAWAPCAAKPAALVVCGAAVIGVTCA